MANKFVPITDLPLLPGAPGLGQELAIQASGVTYRVDARSFPLVTDMFVTWGGQTAALPGSRQIMQGTGIAIDTSTPGQIIINATNNGTVTSVGLSAPTGFAVSGSPINGAGTLVLSYAPGYQGFTTLEAGLIASAVQPGDNISDLVNDVGYITGISGSDVIAALGYTPYDAANPNGYTDGATWGVNLNSVPAIITDLGALANASGALTNDGSGNLSWVPAAGTGTVTSVGVSVPTGMTVVSGSPVTTSGTITLGWDVGYQGFTSAEAALIGTALQPGDIGVSVQGYSANLAAYAGGDTPSAFTLGIVDAADAAAWRSAIGAGTSSLVIGGSDGQIQFNNSGSLGGSSGLTWNTGTATLTATNIAGNGFSITALNASNLTTGTVADARLSSNVALKNAANVFTQMQRIAYTGSQEQLRLNHDDALLTFYNGANSARSGYLWFRAGNASQIWVEANQALQIGTNNALRMTIEAAGNVSINAPSSGAALSVAGQIDASTNLANPLIINSTHANGPYQTFARSGSPFGYIGNGGQMGANFALDAFALVGTSRIQIGNSAPAIDISSGGNVSIAAPSSGFPLSVEGNARFHLPSASNSTFRGYDFGIIGDSTSYGSVGMNIQSGELRYRAGFGGWGGYHTFYTNGAERFVIDSSGGVSVNTPSSGNSLTVAGINGNTGIRYNSNSVGVALGYVTGTTAFIGTITSHQLNLLAGNASRITISSAGNVVVNAPSSGTAFSVTGAIVSSGSGGGIVAKGNAGANSGPGLGLEMGADGGVGYVQAYNRTTSSYAPTKFYSLSWSWNNGTSDVATLDGSGNLTVTGDVTAFYSSDARLKENVVPIKDALAKIERIRGVEFDWTQDYIDNHGGEDGYFIRRHDVGVIAQEVQAVLPEIVGERQDGTLAVKYDRLTALLIQAVKELDDKVESLERRLH